MSTAQTELPVEILEQQQLAPWRAASIAEVGSPLSPDAILLGLVLAFIKLLIHIGINVRAQHVGYGIFRDELYYLVCGRRLAWGYLDNQPLIAVLARISDTLFGMTGCGLSG